MGVEVRSHKGPEKEDMDFPVIKVKLSDTIPHEQTIPSELKWFIESVQETRTIHWPMLIGNRNHTILDGHHRAAGLQELGYTEAPAILIDYYDDDLIQLDTWYPRVNYPLDQVISQLEKLDIEITEVDPGSFDRKALDSREITAFIGNGNRLYTVKGERESIFKLVRDRWLDNIIYYDDADMCMEKTDQDHTAIISWAYTKPEILAQVKNGVVHLPKTTRHTLKYNVPKGEYPLDELAREDD